jgi:geranylgeranyl reductase family protein
MKHFDVIVVGAGPVGGYIAGAIAQKGYSVALLEEHREIGKPVQCAGLVSPRVFELLGYEVGIVNQVRGAVVHSPSGRTLAFDGKRPKANVIDRTVFDSHIVHDAVDCCCQLRLGSKVTKTGHHEKGIFVKSKEAGRNIEMSASLIIGSDGCGSVVARSFGFPQPKEMLIGFGAEFVGEYTSNKEFVDILVGNNLAPGFFAWNIPTDNGARIGLCVTAGKHKPRHYFDSLLDIPAVKERLEGLELERYIAGVIPLGPMKTICTDRVMLAGDSAAHIKPLSGGGIYLGLLCGSHCADVAAAALEEGNLSAKRLREYEKLIKNDVGKELKKAYTLRKIYTGLSDKHLEEGFDILSNEKIMSYIAKSGDIDYPAGLTKTVLQKAPKLMKFAGPVLKCLI